MLSPFWRKVLSDVWGNKTRTMLVVLSIAVGVFAVGAMTHMNLLVARDLVESYQLIHPAHATLSLATDPLISTFAAFDDDLVEVVRRVEGVAEAEGVRTVPMRFKHPAYDNWYIITLIALPDYDNIRINRIRPEFNYTLSPEKWPPGAWPPPEHEMLVERSSLIIPQMGFSRARLGDMVTVQAPDGTERQVRLAGLAYDFSRKPATAAGLPYAFVTPETLEWLGGPPGYSDLNIRVSGDAWDRAYIERVTRRVRDKIKEGGYTVGYTETPEPGRLPANDLFQTISLVLGVIGFFSLFLAGFLVINTVSAILAQQTRQIGVMKAIGASFGQMIGMYLALVAVFGLLAFVIAVPLAVLGARGFVSFLAYFLNFELGEFSVPPEAILAEVAMALLAPLLAALWPVINGTRITVREAISSYGLGHGQWGESWVDRCLGRLQLLPRPLALALRNTFRRKGRLTLTLLTLILACAIFMAVLSARSSLYRMVDDMIRYWNFDVEIFFTDTYRLSRVVDEIERLPGVAEAENLSLDTAYRIRADGSESKPLRVIAALPETHMLDPVIVEGRWLLPGDENAILLNKLVLKDEPDINLGDEITLKVHGHEATWRVVGFYQVLSVWHTDVHVNYTYFSRYVNQPAQASGIAVKTWQHDDATQLATARALEQHFKASGVRIALTYTTSMLRVIGRAMTDALIILLSMMAALVAFVGGLGLMGTMSINVLERTREIGVMRAIGASDGILRQIVMIEGVLIGLLSWFIGALLAYPLGQALSTGIGVGIMGNPLPYAFSVEGALLCLVGVLGIASAASFLPAQRASRLTVREVLAYE